MGTLTPGATYIYERDGDTVYAREAGSLERRVVGYDYKQNKISEDHLWKEIRSAANSVLQDALNRVKILYELSNQHGKE